LGGGSVGYRSVHQNCKPGPTVSQREIFEREELTFAYKSNIALSEDLDKMPFSEIDGGISK
jgi:hypothetical protein